MIFNCLSLLSLAQSVRRDSLFWLMQYQSLMEARPQGLLEGLEPTLVRHVAIAGALHCLPFLATLPSLLPDLDDESLESVSRITSDCKFFLSLQR